MTTPQTLTEAFNRVAALVDQTPGNPGLALVHIQAVFQELAAIATDAAEQLIPGYGDLVARLSFKEQEILATMDHEGLA